MRKFYVCWYHTALWTDTIELNEDQKADPETIAYVLTKTKNYSNGFVITPDLIRSWSLIEE